MTEHNVILSAGAAQALATVAARVLKRPRGVLSANDEVKEAEQEYALQVRRERDAKRAKMAFEANARIVPDAATDVARERALRATATKGAVALFNAVAAAQRGSTNEKPVDKEMFMGMLKRGVTDIDFDEEEREEEPKADWLKDNYLTKNSRKLRHFDNAGGGSEEDSEADEEQGQDRVEELEFEDVDEFDDEGEFEDEEEAGDESEDDE